MDVENYRKIGGLLRKAREELRLPVDQAARALHIRVRYLEALEEGRLDELPGLAYTRGYLQTYASYLGLDKEEILRRFEEVEAQLARRGFYLPDVLGKEKSPRGAFVWGGLAAAVAVYVIWAVAVRSPTASVSIVDRFPERERSPAAISVDDMQEIPCLSPQAVLYPPCHRAKQPQAESLPLPRRMESVMELLP